MPIVEINRDPPVMSDKMLEPLIERLRAVCARELSTPSIKLTEDDIIVRVRDHHPYDVGVRDVEFVIHAHDYPHRMDIGEDELAKRILDGINDIIPWEYTTFVQLMLHPIGYAAR